jgi:hypothetical protein
MFEKMKPWVSFINNEAGYRTPSGMAWLKIPARVILPIIFFAAVICLGPRGMVVTVGRSIISNAFSNCYRVSMMVV